MVPGLHARGVVVLCTNKKLSRAVLGVVAALVVTVGPVAAIGTASATASKPAASMSAGALSSGTYDVVTLWGSDKWTGQWILKVSGGHVTGLAWFIGPGGPYLAPYAITGTAGAGGINLNRSQCAVDAVQIGCFHQAYSGKVTADNAEGYWAQVPAKPDIPSQTFTMTFVSASTTNWCWPQPVPLYCAATPVPPDTPPSTLTLSSGTYEVVTHWSSDTWTGHWVFTVTGGKVSGLAYIHGPGGPYLAPFAITGTVGSGGINLNRSQCAVNTTQKGCFHQDYSGRILSVDKGEGYWAQIPAMPRVLTQTFTMTFVSASTTGRCWPQSNPKFC
jgi:hypothetical protein